MRIRLLLTALVLLALVTFAFGDASVQFRYTPPQVFLTSDGCFTGGACIPDGTPVNVYKGATLLGSPIMNGGGMGMGCGFFMLNYVTGVPGSDWWCEVVYGGCTYTSRYFTTVNGPQGIAMVQADWDCVCGGDTCNTRNPMEEGFYGPLDILDGETKSFVDTCTVRITAQGGDAHDVSVDVYNGVPECHPVAYDYMSRVVAVYWDGSADEGTSLLVRMYYSQDELTESGFSDWNCLRASRINEFACSWAPILPEERTPKYVEFTTDRSGFFTFDCHGTTPRRIPLNSDPTIAAANNELVLSWQTVDEFETYRFHILRAEGPEGPFTEIATVSSQLPDIKATASYNYEFWDRGLENGHVYYYRLSREDLHGNQDDYPGIFSGVPSLNGDAVEIENYALHPAYPNPFNPETRIAYDVLDAGHVDLRVFDILGREVALLVDDVKQKGRHNIIFNAKDLPSGLYFYRIDIGGQFTSTQKILLIK
ncbi:T9SS type A sorting domain-containing protein [bacterium]|nr:T9SS type A sorting domain-containing protein [bacterium]